METKDKTKRTGLVALSAVCTLLTLIAFTPTAQAGADPAFSSYGYGEIVPVPNPAITGENTHITVTVSNPGDTDATNVEVQLSFNDWGVTFSGWQPIGTVTIPLIPAGGTADAEYDYTFENRTHTCLEALILSADENTDTSNDRGQINLEVVNAGETFEYYVPIVNNEGEEIQVLVRGACMHGEPAGEPNFEVRCKVPEEQELVIPPGGEELIPVRVDFGPGTPAGYAVEIIVDAFDVNDPGNAQAWNHVLLRIVHNSPWALKQDCLAKLNALPPLPGPRAARRANKAIQNQLRNLKRHIENSLSPDLWQDEFRLEPRGAGRGPAQEMVAAKDAVRLMELEGLPLDWKVALDACARALTDAERILAQTAITDQGGDPEAEALLQEGDDYRILGAYGEAVRAYGQALREATR